MSLLDPVYCRARANEHRQNASRRRVEAKAYVPADPEYDHLMRKVGFHTIQAGLWDKQARSASEKK